MCIRDRYWPTQSATPINIPADPRTAFEAFRRSVGALNPSALLDTLGLQDCTMLHRYPQSAGLYDAAWTPLVSRGLYNAAQTPLVSRVVQCCTDTLGQQGCTMLHGHPWSAGLYSAARIPSVSRVVQHCRDTQSAGLYNAAGYTASQCCTQHPQ